MPAVNPVRLRFQIEDLITSFSMPQKFHRQLTDMFGLYANRVLKFGDSSQPQPFIPMYHLPDPVMRQLKLDLKPRIIEDPESSFKLADELWQDDFFEVRQLAIFFLDSIPVKDPEPILKRLKDWVVPELDQILTTELLSIGLHNLQSKFSRAWETFIETFLSNDNPKMVALGLEGLQESLKSPAFDNLPAIYRMVSPVIRNPHPLFFNALLNMMEALVSESPKETAYFIRQAMAVSDSPGTERIIKQSLQFFPKEMQQELKLTLKK